MCRIRSHFCIHKLLRTHKVVGQKRGAALSRLHVYLRAGFSQAQHSPQARHRNCDADKRHKYTGPQEALHHQRASVLARRIHYREGEPFRSTLRVSRRSTEAWVDTRGASPDAAVSGLCRVYGCLSLFAERGGGAHDIVFCGFFASGPHSGTLRPVVTEIRSSTCLFACAVSEQLLVRRWGGAVRPNTCAMA